MVAITPAPVATPPTVAPAKSGRRSRRKSSIGPRLRSSTTTNTTAAPSPPPTKARTDGRSHPSRPSTSPASTPASASPNSTMPQPSTAWWRCDVDSVSPARATPASTDASRAITAYEPRQPAPRPESSPAASNGPTAMPAPTPAPHIPVARTLACPPGKEWPINPRPQATTAAAPSPCPTRASTSVRVSGANVARTDVAASTSAPITNIRRRP